MQTTSFTQDKLHGIHDFRSDVFKLALYSTVVPLSTTEYTPLSEVVGAGYTAEGITLAVIADGVVINRVAVVSFADVSWAGATFTTRSALIYNASKSNKSICVLDFGRMVSASGETFGIKFPPATDELAIIREV